MRGRGDAETRGGGKWRRQGALLQLAFGVGVSRLSRSPLGTFTLSPLSSVCASLLPASPRRPFASSPHPQQGPNIDRWFSASVLLTVASGSNSAVECDLAKVEVAGSNPVSRSRILWGELQIAS